MPLDARSSTPAPARRPGDFQRHPSTGAPYVNHPTETTKAGKPKRVMYGRPSSLGKQIENTTNLQKWSERAVALGAFLDFTSTPEVSGLFNELDELDRAKLVLDDADTRPLLDAIAVKAKSIAQAGIAAERGTHTHALTEDADNEKDWIERARSGEDLGIPVEAQQALVAAWETMLDAEGIEILAVETAVVDDTWRQAGTLDRIARLTKERKFILPGGEVVSLPAGWVGVLDVKTGRLRAGRDQHPDYWHGYAVQIASYAQSVPYDPDTETRGEWGWPIDQQYGIIAHLDVAAAIDGTAKCRLVLVDLEAGRAAGELCVAARQWEKARNVFSAVDEQLGAYEVQVAVSVPNSADGQAAAVEPETADPNPKGSTAPAAATIADEGPATSPADVPSPAADEGAVRPPTTAPSSAPSRRDALRERRMAMEASANDTGWGDQFRAEWARHGITPESTDDEIEAALDAIEPPFDPDPAPPHGIVRPAAATAVDPDGDIVPDHVIAELVSAIAASDVRDIVNAWLAEAKAAGRSFDPRTRSRERYVLITFAAFALALAVGALEDDEMTDRAREVLCAVIPLDRLTIAQPTIPIGAVLASLNIDEAAGVREFAIRLRQIAPVPTGAHVAAVLAAA